MSALLTATRNRHKVREIREMLGGNFQYLTLNDFPGAPAVIEDAATFAGNAAKKADGLADWLLANPGAIFSVIKEAAGAFYVLADDSGLEVDALDGAPGVHSARFAALDTGGQGNSSDRENNQKLLRLLRDVAMERRSGRFRCVLAWRELVLTAGRAVAAGPATLFFDGACEGQISFGQSGAGGFGYDPLFVPDGHKQSFAELGDAVKNGMSHRARALQKLKLHLSGLQA